MRFFYNIGKKHRGNYRPKIQFGFELYQEDIAHNPRLPHIILTYGYSAIEKKLQKVEKEAFDKFLKFDLEFLNKPNTEPWALFVEPRRGSEDHAMDLSIWGMPNLSIFREGYQSNPRTRLLEFYAPWKPGASPDYSEIIPVLFSIRDTVATALQEGLDSGESEERSGDMSVTLREKKLDWQGIGTSVERPKPQTVMTEDGRCGVVRKLDID